MTLEYIVRPMSDLDGFYLAYQIWTRELDEETISTGVICQAVDAGDHEVGKLAINEDGTILVVEVEPEFRRKGIATRMLSELRAAGYLVQHDWENMRDDGEAWARSLGDRPPD